MDFGTSSVRRRSLDRSFGRAPLKIVIDHTRPIVEVDISGGGGSATLTGTGTSKVVSHGGPPKSSTVVNGGPPASSERPRPILDDTYTILDIPISTSKAVRVGCWPSSPIDSDALKEKVCLHILQSLNDDSESVFVPSADIALVSKLIEREKKLGPSQVDGIRYCNDPTLIVPALKKYLKSNEITFKSQYSHSTMEYRHCITANDSFWWKQESSGIMWAGVYGIDDICVVTLSGHLDRKRVHGYLASFGTEFLLSLFRKCLLSELEDLADPPCKLSEEFDGSFDPPFCIVSETPPTVPDESGHETSSAEYAVPDAVSFVQGSGLLEQAKDSGGAIKLAISAFERLMGKKFEAKEIEVTVLFGRKSGTGYTRDLDVSEIGDYLAAV